MGLLDRVRQQRPCLVALLTLREPDPEGHHDVGQVVTGLVADLVRVYGDLERVGLGPACRQDVDIRRRAAADAGEEQVDRGEVGASAGADGDLAAAVVRDEVPGVLDALEPDGAGYRSSGHARHPVTGWAICRSSGHRLPVSE